MSQRHNTLICISKYIIGYSLKTTDPYKPIPTIFLSRKCFLPIFQHKFDQLLKTVGGFGLTEQRGREKEASF